MVLKRPELCMLIEFTSWTSVQAWLTEVVEPAFKHLVHYYLRPHLRLDIRAAMGGEGVKEYFVNRAPLLEALVEQRVSELNLGVEAVKPQPGWSLLDYYEHFIIEATALDRLEDSIVHDYHHISSKDWAKDPETLFANMYELTEAICYNYWKPAETEMWDSDDSDVPFTDPRDVPY